MTERSRRMARSAGLALALTSLSCPPGAAPPLAPSLNTIGEARALLSAPAFGQARRSVDLRGVVTYFDALHGVLYFQDQTGALTFAVGALEARVFTGEFVRL